MEQLLCPSLSSFASDARPHVAFLHLPSTPSRGGSGSWRDEACAGWLTLCYQLTPRIQYLSATAALLDLGVCTDVEASMVVAGLLRRLGSVGISARVGIASTAALAQLALLVASPRQQVASVMPGEILALVRGMPVAHLSQLLPCGAITPEIVARLHRYGLHTLGHVATLTESALYQQFGRAGVELAALVNGRDPHPFCPTPLPKRLHFSMRLPAAAPASRVLAALPAWTQQIAATLKDTNLAVRELRLVVGWERGSRVVVRAVLRQHTLDPATLLEAMRKLLMPLLLQHAIAQGIASSRAADAVLLLDTLRLTALDVAPVMPQQYALWQRRAPRRAALSPVAEALARRHGRTLVLCARRVAAEAIFPEERYRLHSIERVSDEMPSTRSRAPLSPSPVVSPVTARAYTDACGWEDVPHRLRWW